MPSAFANELKKLYDQKYAETVLNYISERFIRQRIETINFVAKENDRKAKEARKEAKAKKGGRKDNKGFNSMSFGKKVKQIHFASNN